ncbi:MAG: mevalonate kinase [Kiritimatiellia bacterium]
MKAIAPGKIILSGEHAVVYGQPAVAMAIDLCAETTITSEPSKEIVFTLPDLRERESFKLRALREMKRRVLTNYHLFQEGEIGIREVLVKPIELVLFSFITLLDGLHIKLEAGMNIGLTSNIPVGCGLGSSAASVLSELRAVGHYLRMDFRPDWHMKYSMLAENMQHGQASGLDSYVSYHGGCVRFQDGAGVAIPMPSIPIFVVQTGVPDTTTGECVMHVRDTIGASAIWNDFGAVANEVAAVAGKRDLASMKAAIRENHRLLCAIGVVPEKVQAFIRAIEADGGAAKICGAGAVRGEHAGIVMVIADAPPLARCAEYGYTVSSVRGDPLGLRVV